MLGYCLTVFNVKSLSGGWLFTTFPFDGYFESLGVRFSCVLWRFPALFVFDQTAKLVYLGAPYDISGSIALPPPPPRLGDSCPHIIVPRLDVQVGHLQLSQTNWSKPPEIIEVWTQMASGTPGPPLFT